MCLKPKRSYKEHLKKQWKFVSWLLFGVIGYVVIHLLSLVISIYVAIGIGLIVGVFAGITGGIMHTDKDK